MQYIIVKSTCKRLNSEQKQISLLEEQLIWWGSLSDRNSDPRFTNWYFMISKIAIFLNSYIGVYNVLPFYQIRGNDTPPPFFFFNLKRIALVVTRDLRITGEVDDIYIGDLNTYFDFAKFTKAWFFFFVFCFCFFLLLTGL